MNESQELDDLEIRGEHEVELPRTLLWKYLNDPEVLQRCIKGCESVELRGEGDYCASFKVRVGPLKKTFKADLKVINQNPPQKYQLNCVMNAGFAGNITGEADVELTETTSNNTRLRYEARAEVEGWIGELGVLVLGNAAERYMQRFFTQFVEIIEEYEEYSE